MPSFAITFYFGLQFFQPGFLKFQNLPHLITNYERMGGGNCRIHEQDVLEFVVAGRKDAGALVDLLGIEQVEHGEVLHDKDFVHTFEAEAAFPIEEIGNVGLFEAGLVGELETGEMTGINALPKGLAKVLLQNAKFHNVCNHCHYIYVLYR